jgi:uncharacterized protein (DUF4415 family)
MSHTKTTGIGGILDGLLSTAHGSQAKMRRLPSEEPPKTDPFDGDTPAKTPRIAARRGRPPGKGRKRKKPKEKMTVWLDADLIAEYREWSWDARCQLSTLVEEALIEYWNHRGNRKLFPVKPRGDSSPP